MLGDNDLYDNETAAPEEKPGRLGEEGDGEKREDEGGSTFLVPKDCCPEMKPGDTISGKIKRVLEDQYEVIYEPTEQREEGGGEGSEGMDAAPDGPPSAMAGLMD